MPWPRSARCSSATPGRLSESVGSLACRSSWRASSRTSSAVGTVFDRLADASLVTVIGRGLAFPTAYETALKVRELSAIPAEAFSPPDLMHGPIAAVGSSGAVWWVSTSGRDQPDREAFETVGSSAGVSVAVSDRPELLARADVAVPVAGGMPEWAAPLITVLPGQAAALRLAELRGIDVDRPPGLSKVTLTR